jgi:ATP-binding cassette, subfamily B, bacterial MsbA
MLGRIKLPSRAFWRGLFHNYRRLLVYVKPYWQRLAIAGIFLTINSLFGLAIPLVIQRIVDGVLASASLQQLNRVTLGLIVLFVIRAVLDFGQTYEMAWVAERVVANLRKQLFTHLQAMPLRFFNNTRIGELLSRLGNDTAMIQEAATSTLLSLLSQTIMLVGSFVIIFFMDWRLTLLMVLVVPFAVVGGMVLGRMIRRISRQVQDRLAEISGVAEEAFAGIRIVKSFAREPYEIAHYSVGVERLFVTALKRARVRAILGPTIGIMAYIALAIVLWFGGREVIEGRLSPGELVSFLLYTMMVAAPIAAFTGLYSQLQAALGASERVFELLDSPPELQDDPRAVTLPSIAGRVRFDQVSFDYGDALQTQEVLHDVNLDVAPGLVVALVGPSGAGKTTLVNLIPRFYDVTAGRILIDGLDVRGVQLRSLREQIGIVPQETALFSGTVRENIHYGKLEATEYGIIAAARAANAHDFIMALPRGYDTLVGERGVKLSGGQRQRVAIARAILKAPSILILDEATSSLDSESEQAVQEALERLMRGRTTFVIAHRLSTIINADQIVVIENGRVVEQGSHADLLSHAEGLYRRLYAIQFRSEVNAWALP